MTATATDCGPRDLSAAFPPRVLREYALLADGERGILVGPRGDFAWMCAPRFDSDAVFCTLVGGAGLYAVTPAEDRFVWGGSYEDRSLIWRDRWVTTTGIIECREALAFPGDPHTAVVLRRVIALKGPARVRVIRDARAGFGQKSMDELDCRDGVWSARSGALHLRWSGGGAAVQTGRGALTVELELAEGAHRDLVLEISDHALTGQPVDARAAWQATEAAWARAVPELGDTLARRDARHAYAVLRGLTSQGGGMVAAATMSLPEQAEAGRNYDYRYAWIRDQCYAGQAVAVTEPLPLLDDAVAFISERILADGRQLKPAYRTDGTAVPDEASLPHLAGYPGGADKMGNWVNRQFQLRKKSIRADAVCVWAAWGSIAGLPAIHRGGGSWTEGIGNRRPYKARLRACDILGWPARAGRQAVAARGLARAGEARRLGEGAGAEHRAEAVVRARVEPL